MTGVLTWLVAGAPQRRSRLHDELGVRVPLDRALRNGPRALMSGIARLAFGHRAVRPWISYDAQALLAGFLAPTSRVLEFGSGMSTLWYARHAGEVVSIEDNAEWFGMVEAMMTRRGVCNLRYRLATDVSDYAAVTEAERGDGFDLVMVDGSAREACIRAALPLLRLGGILYLDNSDKGAAPGTGDVPAARGLLIAAAAERGATLTAFTDFAPTQLFVQQGLMLQLPAGAAA